MSYSTEPPIQILNVEEIYLTCDSHVPLARSEPVGISTTKREPMAKKRGPVVKKIRIILDLTEDFYERRYQLQHKLEAESKARAIRLALEVYDTIVEQVQENEMNLAFVPKAGGDPVICLLPGIPRRSHRSSVDTNRATSSPQAN